MAIRLLENLPETGKTIINPHATHQPSKLHISIQIKNQKPEINLNDLQTVPILGPYPNESETNPNSHSNPSD